MANIAVLMSTYNGDKYIEEQTNSILNQNLSKDDTIHLFIRDDGSDPKKSEFVRKHEFPQNVTIMMKENVGVKLSFYDLIESISGFDYYFLSDQDDIWLPNKVSRFIQEFEARGGIDNASPVGVYSDLWIADEFGESTGERMKTALISKGITNQTEFHRGRLLKTYFATGASMAFNEAARQASVRMGRDVFAESHMHDAAIATMLILTGDLFYLNEPLVNYRQHGGNLLGAEKKRSVGIRRISEYNFEMNAPYQLLVHSNIIAGHLDVLQDFSNVVKYLNKALTSNNQLIGLYNTWRLRSKLFDRFAGPKVLLLYRKIWKEMNC